MSNPLPEPYGYFDIRGNAVDGYTADQLRAHAAAEVAAARDCRTCAHYHRNYYQKDTCTLAYDQCINADRYKEMTAIRLWRVT